MLDETQDVSKVDPSTTDTQAVNDNGGVATPPATPEQKPVADSPVGVEALDERGVPWKNRTMELQRKLGDLTEQLPTMLKDAVAQANAPKEQSYTIAQLENYAIEHPEYRPWVEEQKAKKLEEMVETRTQKVLQRERAEGEKKSKQFQAYNYVKTNYPEMFTKDTLGNEGWNNSHPMVQQVSAIMSDPDLSNRPDALAVAADIAYARIAKQSQLRTQEQVKTVESEKRKLERRTMVDGGVNSPQESQTAMQSAMDELRNKGSVSSAAKVMKIALGLK